MAAKKTGKPRKKKAVVKNPKVPRTRNAGTQTEAAFFSWLRSGLRRMSLYWKPRQQCLNEGKRPYTGPNKKQKIEIHCEGCGGYFPIKQVEADHVGEGAGSLRSFQDAAAFLERLFAEREGWRRLCLTCHKQRTEEQRKKRNEAK